MTRRRPKVLVAIEPPLLADLVGRALVADDVDVVIRREPPWQLRRWDVAVVPSRRWRRVRARHVVQIADRRAPDFCSLVALVRRLCSVT